MIERVAGGLSVPRHAAGELIHDVGHGGRFEYDLRLDDRGVHRLGPATCRLTDVAGLFTRVVEVDADTVAVVYPDVYGVDPEDLSPLVEGTVVDDRETFDRLREFAPGDAIRDIHWRASARRADAGFVVAEYRDRSATTRVELVGESALGSADAMASTVASLAVALQDAGVPVSVAVPAGECAAPPGDAETVLRLLARTGDGWVSPDRREAADVRVRGEGGRATVSLVDRDVAFDRLAGDDRGREVIP